MRTIVSALAAFGLLVTLNMTLPASAAVIDPNWVESVFSVNRDAPGDNSAKQHTALAWAPDGTDRLFVLEKEGRVRVLSGALTTAKPNWTTFVTISPIVTIGETGLLGLAFDPDFVRNRFVYFFVTTGFPGGTQIIRYDATTNLASGKTVVLDRLPTGGVHNGGGIGFAGDGKLYWSIGDGGRGKLDVSEDLRTLFAKVGRSNRDGTVPPDNPYTDGNGPTNDFIFARGFRNPFTMQIQPSTGQIWLNVVGTRYEQVFIVGRSDHGGYNRFENNQPLGFITPKIAYRTNGSDSYELIAVSRSANIATFTTSMPHGLRLGGNVSISGVPDASFNQANLYVSAVPSPTTFTARQLGADNSSSGGQAVTLDQGGCLTGGAFYDSTLAPQEYRGNFFYGDCNSDRIMRARIDPLSNDVLSVDHWATEVSVQVDVAQGPDGALYYVGLGTNNIFRAAFNATAQGIVVGNQNLRIDEGGEVVTTVRLAAAPAADVIVTTTLSSGDTDIGVIGGATLRLTPSNWMRPQNVRLAAAADPDQSDDFAIVSISAGSLTTIPVRVSVLDLPSSDAIFGDGFE